MSHHWYHTAAWRKRRAGHLRGEPLCRMCSKMGYATPAQDVDHVIPHRGDRDLFWQGELQSLCAHHHRSVKQADEARGYSVEVGADGMPTDDNHPACRYSRER